MQKKARAFDTKFNPIGLWTFKDTFNDSSGNSYHLTEQTGVTIRYCEFLPGLGGVLFNGSGSLWHDVSGTALERTGDITIEAMLFLDTATALNSMICGYVGPSGAEANNWLWSLATDATSVYGAYRWVQQSGVNVDSIRALSGYGSNLHQPILLGCTRLANVIQFWVNGIAFGPASTALTTPTGGGSSRFRIGAATDSAQRLSAIIGGVKIIDSALSADNMKEDYNRTLGNVLGYR